MFICIFHQLIIWWKFLTSASPRSFSNCMRTSPAYALIYMTVRYRAEMNFIWRAWKKNKWKMLRAFEESRDKFMNPQFWVMVSDIEIISTFFMTTFSYCLWTNKQGAIIKVLKWAESKSDCKHQTSIADDLLLKELPEEKDGNANSFFTVFLFFRTRIFLC